MKHPEYDETILAKHKLRVLYDQLDESGVGLVDRKKATTAILNVFNVTEISPFVLRALFPSVLKHQQIDYEQFKQLAHVVGEWCVLKELLENDQINHLEHRWASISDPEHSYTLDFPPKTASKAECVVDEDLIPRGVEQNLLRYKALRPKLREDFIMRIAVTSKIRMPVVKPGKSPLSFLSGGDVAEKKHSVPQKVDAETQLKKLIAGGMAGSLAKTVIAPMDRTKIIFQTSSRVYTLKAAIQEMINIKRDQGTSALWRGNSATLSRVFPYAGIQFVSFDLYKGLLLNQGEEQLTPSRRIAAGSLAGATSVAFTYPLDLLRARMSVQRVDAGGLRHNFRTVYHTAGVNGLYRGFFPTIVGILPYAGLSFGTFETLKIFVSDYYGTKTVNAGQKFFCGAIAGYVAQSLTYPLDIVRRRIQTDGVFSAGAPPRYTGIVQTLRLVASKEGVRGGLFKGVTMNWIKGPIAQGISFTTFDLLKDFFQLEQHK